MFRIFHYPPSLPQSGGWGVGEHTDYGLVTLTGGWYRSTPHRVRNLSGHGRLSFPLFLDPGCTSEVPPLPDRAAAGGDGRRRWDGEDLLE